MQEKRRSSSLAMLLEVDLQKGLSSGYRVAVNDDVFMLPG